MAPAARQRLGQQREKARQGFPAPVPEKMARPPARQSGDHGAAHARHGTAMWRPAIAAASHELARRHASSLATAGQPGSRQAVMAPAMSRGLPGITSKAKRPAPSPSAWSARVPAATDTWRKTASRKRFGRFPSHDGRISRSDPAKAATPTVPGGERMVAGRGGKDRRRQHARAPAGDHPPPLRRANSRARPGRRSAPPAVSSPSSNRATGTSGPTPIAARSAAHAAALLPKWDDPRRSGSR